jgi:hypothetical protein
LPDPLDGMELPEKAAPTHVVGDYVLFLPKKSAAAAEAYVANYRKLAAAKRET